MSKNTAPPGQPAVWQRRWIALDAGFLVISADEGTPPLLKVPLTEIGEIRGNAASRDEFLLGTPKTRMEYKAASPAEADEWCRVCTD